MGTGLTTTGLIEAGIHPTKRAGTKRRNRWDRCVFIFHRRSEANPVRTSRPASVPTCICTENSWPAPEKKRPRRKSWSKDYVTWKGYYPNSNKWFKHIGLQLCLNHLIKLTWISKWKVAWADGGFGKGSPSTNRSSGI